MIHNLSVFRLVIVALVAFGSMATGGCGLVGDDDRNQRLAVWDAESGDWRYLTPASRSAFEAEWMANDSGVLVIEAVPAGGALPEGKSLLVFRELSGRARWQVEGSMSDRQPVAGASSPDGREVAILRDSFGTEERVGVVEIVDAATGKVLRESAPWTTHLTAGASPAATDIAWLASGEIAVVSHSGSGFNDLRWFQSSTLDLAVEVQPTTDSEVWLAHSLAGSLVAVFSISPYGPGSRLDFRSPSVGAERRIEVGTGGNIAADFSPDGQKLVIAHDEVVDVVDVGTDAVRKVRAAQTQGVSIGADGRIAIAWGSEMTVFGEDGSDLRQVVSLSDGKTARTPSWSPGGDSLAFFVEPRYRD